MTQKKKTLPASMRFKTLSVLLIILSILLIADLARSEGFFRLGSKNLKATSFFSSPKSSITAVQPNFHIVAPGVWRSAQLNEEAILRMKAHGLKTIINLRESNATERWEKDLSQKLGIDYYHFPMLASKQPELKTVDAILAILGDARRHPVLVHCHGGKDRTGMIVAAYKLAQGNEKFPDIYQEMQMYGYDERKYPAMLKTLQHWCAARGLSEPAQEIGLIEKFDLTD